ncbi:major capsid protein [Microviridae sp.]|nr:major capsid protein [Microviridae sp.]
MKSVMHHSFAQVPTAQIPRSSFDRSHGRKMTLDADYLYPLFVDEALPGDTFNVRTAGFVRMTTPIFPIMDNLVMETFYFAVPNRLLWDNWQRFMGERNNPDDSIDFRIPENQAPAGGFPEGQLHDYLGVPPGLENVYPSALFARAYLAIHNEWFRDQNLQDSTAPSTDDGPDNNSYYHFLIKRGKRHDYFTSCLPWPQKGPDVELPLGTAAPVVGIGDLIPKFKADDGSIASNTPFVYGQDSGSGPNIEHGAAASPTLDSNVIWDQTQLSADLTTATAVTVNTLREAVQIQKLYERDARGGTRYIELVKAHFGVDSPDLRATRPEYLGGGSTPINVSPVASTTDTEGVDSGRPLGDLSAVVTGAFQGHGFTKSFTEHCVVMGLINIRADLTYQQGLHRMFARREKIDFYWPAFAGLGEQEVLNREIYTQGNAQDTDVFGYQERFAEYRYAPSTIHGAFRSSATASLDAWHLSEDFASLPLLNNEFITPTTPMDRVLAVTDEAQFIGDFYHKFIAARPMPVFGIPGNMDRF